MSGSIERDNAALDLACQAEAHRSETYRLREEYDAKIPGLQLHIKILTQRLDYPGDPHATH